MKQFLGLTLSATLATPFITHVNGPRLHFHGGIGQCMAKDLKASQKAFRIVNKISLNNGYGRVSEPVVRAIELASLKYSVDIKVLTSIAIVETGLGKYSRISNNKNGSIDIGLFQINSVNFKYCKEYKLETMDGNTMCAAKLLARLKKHSHEANEYIGLYHSGTLDKKLEYIVKVQVVLGVLPKPMVATNGP